MGRKKNATETYDVGYCKPPAQHRFLAGRSGNPTGESRKKRSKDADNLSDIIFDELQRMIAITTDGKPEKITMQRAVIRSALAQAARGNSAALRHSLLLFDEGRKSSKAASKRHLPDYNKLSQHDAAKAYEEFLKIES